MILKDSDKPKSQDRCEEFLYFFLEKNVSNFSTLRFYYPHQNSLEQLWSCLEITYFSSFGARSFQQTPLFPSENNIVYQKETYSKYILKLNVFTFLNIDNIAQGGGKGVGYRKCTNHWSVPRV